MGTRAVNLAMLAVAGLVMLSKGLAPARDAVQRWTGGERRATPPAARGDSGLGPHGFGGGGAGGGGGSSW